MNQVKTCWVYRSSRKDEMYLYLAAKDSFDKLPQPLMQGFGQPTLVMELELHPGRKLARADIDTVMDSLAHQGFYLQMPPKLKPELYHGNDL